MMLRRLVGATLAVPVALSVVMAGCDAKQNPVDRSASSTATRELVESVDASADTYVKSGTPNQAQGAATFLRVQDSGSNRSLVAFNQTAIESLVGDDTLVSAHVELTIADNGNNWGLLGRTIDLHRVIIPWTEPGATWSCAIDSVPSNSSPDCSGATAWEMGNPSLAPWEPAPAASTLIVNNQSGAVLLDVTADVLAFVQGTKENHGFIIKKTDEGAAGRLDFSSRQGASPPRLILVTSEIPPPPVPPPSSATILVTGDTYLRSGVPNQNQGALLTLRIQQTGDKRSLVQVEQSAIAAATAGRTVLNATLQVMVANNGGNWGANGRTLWDPLESTCRHASLSIL